MIAFAIAGVMPGGSFIGGAVAARADADNATANKNAHVHNMTRILKTLPLSYTAVLTRSQYCRVQIEACSMTVCESCLRNIRM